MFEHLFLLLKGSRPRQILKNLSLYTGLVFSGWLFDVDKLMTVTLAVVFFSILTSSVYILNDIVDLESDRKHPFKKRRPIASGKLPVEVALFASLVGFFVSFSLGWWLSFFLFLAMGAYLLLQVIYTNFLKHEPIFDVMIISLGFILRVYAGAVIIGAHINVWLLLCIISFSLFLAIGKRRSELTLLQGKTGSRKVLGRYPEKLLDIYTSMFANTTWLTYALFAFMFPAFSFSGKALTLLADLPKTFRSEKWLMMTVPLVIYGVMRYLHLIYYKQEGESPANILTSDKPMLITVGLWGLAVVGILYGLG